MDHTKDKINELLASQMSANNSLALQLLKGQLKLSKKEALKYIFRYRIQHLWDPKISLDYFEVEGLKVEIFFVEEDDIYAYGLDLVCSIESGTQNILEKEGIGDYDYDFGFGVDKAPTLFESQEIAQKLFEAAIEKI